MDRLDLNTFPNLFIVGAAKSGTTSLHHYLNQHPDVFMCSPKEPHFLINHEIGINRIPVGVCSEKEYFNLFQQGKGMKYRGESSVMYLMFPKIVIPKINKIFGKDAKIIIMLRNPIERAYSGFQHVRRYNVRDNFQDFKSDWTISEERYHLNSDITPASRHKELGMYYKQVKSYLEGMKSVHIIIYDDYIRDFKSEMNKVFDFLGIRRIDINNQKRYMLGGWQWKDKKIRNLIIKDSPIKSFLKFLLPFKSFREIIRNYIQNRSTLRAPEMSKDDRNMLKVFYKEDVKKLSLLLERDLNYWVK